MKSNRSLKTLGLTLVFTLLAVAFAYAMPRVLDSAAEDPPTEEIELIEAEEPTDDATETDEQEPVGEGSEELEEPTGGDEGEPAAKDNHGAATAAAAHCDVKGKAHGELVRAVAKDKNATAASAEAACAEALAAEAEGAADAKRHGKPDADAHGNGKPDDKKSPAPTDKQHGNPHDAPGEAATTGAGPVGRDKAKGPKH